ncbi:hypothetical protein [Kitasatospora sp. NPDC002965]|uniref:hypothetical protein n=1 Tax=Kitasatospora sp. NPDC002965 TaxID=3154775 RepID=UPI0033B23B2F
MTDHRTAAAELLAKGRMSNEADAIVHALLAQVDASDRMAAAFERMADSLTDDAEQAEASKATYRDQDEARRAAEALAEELEEKALDVLFDQGAKGCTALEFADLLTGRGIEATRKVRERWLDSWSFGDSAIRISARPGGLRTYIHAAHAPAPADEFDTV